MGSNWNELSIGLLIVLAMVAGLGVFAWLSYGTLWATGAHAPPRPAPPCPAGQLCTWLLLPRLGEGSDSAREGGSAWQWTAVPAQGDLPLLPPYSLRVPRWWCFCTLPLSTLLQASTTEATGGATPSGERRDEN